MNRIRLAGVALAVGCPLVVEATAADVAPSTPSREYIRTAPPAPPRLWPNGAPTAPVYPTTGVAAENNPLKPVTAFTGYPSPRPAGIVVPATATSAPRPATGSRALIPPGTVPAGMLTPSRPVAQPSMKPVAMSQPSALMTPLPLPVPPKSPTPPRLTFEPSPETQGFQKGRLAEETESATPKPGPQPLSSITPQSAEPELSTRPSPANGAFIQPVSPTAPLQSMDAPTKPTAQVASIPAPSEPVAKDAKETVSPTPVKARETEREESPLKLLVTESKRVETPAKSTETKVELVLIKVNLVAAPNREEAPAKKPVEVKREDAPAKTKAPAKVTKPAKAKREDVSSKTAPKSVTAAVVPPAAPATPDEPQSPLPVVEVNPFKLPAPQLPDPAPVALPSSLPLPTPTAARPHVEAKPQASRPAKMD